MTLLSEPEIGTKQRPVGITLIAGVELALALAGVVFFVLTFAGAIPLAYGRYLVGPGIETLGPFVFLFFGLVMALTAFGMLRLRNWARHITIVFAGIGVFFSVPTVSTAVVSGELSGTIREGVQVILRAAVIWYLLQQPTREAFN